MKIAVLRERNPKEKRCAASPDSVKKLVALGLSVSVETGAGAGSHIADDAFAQAGAKISSLAECCANADIILKVGAPEAEELAAIPSGAILIGLLSPLEHPEHKQSYEAKNLTAFAMELLPRISRAQGMDVLSSQSNLAGYRAVIDAIYEFGKAVPMMMTAAGTVAPAKVLVLGAGVAGLQAIATAKRLGAVVSASDVRPAVKEQVESLGAKFLEVKEEAGAETKGGYAKEMSEEYKRKQAALLAETIAKQDILITTALIPGKPAPVLVTTEMAESMKEGSVIIDLAVASGGNCPLSRPDEIVLHKGVKIIGYSNMPSRVATDATPLYARNLYNFLMLLLDKSGNLAINWEDEIVKATALSRGS